MGRPAGCGAPFPPRESTAFVFRVWGAGTRATPYLGPHDFIELIEQHALLLLRSLRFHQWSGAVGRLLPPTAVDFIEPVDLIEPAASLAGSCSSHRAVS